MSDNPIADSAVSKRLPVIVMGVSGSGKSTLGEALARALELPFIEGDSLHDAHNIAKMRSGHPLNDADRAGWLDTIASELQDEQRFPLGLVLTCSALRRTYRDRLRGATRGLRFLFLRIDVSAAHERLQHRPHHFMPASLVPSQFATLEPPAPEETDIVTLDASAAPATVLARALQALRPEAPTPSPDPSSARRG
ncbi:MAG TPA: gluconokinase [Steroidobacteraceae bacterium]|nr:gluconokinase [Steroidobacteraceae bacterium]